jgi:hypothetical protein
MKRFLRETWELWYWAMFCPSKLQQRMNEWAPTKEKDGQKPDTKSADILESRKDRRFTTQYLLLTFFFSLPLVVAIVIHGHPLGWLLLAVAPLTAYGTSLWCLPLGLHTPLLLGLVYLLQPQAYSMALSNVLINLSFCQPYPISRLVEGLTTGMVASLTTLLLSLWLLRCQRFVSAGSVISIGGTLSVFGGSWLATHSWFFTMVVSGLTGVLLSLLAVLLSLYQKFQEQIKSNFQDEVRLKLIKSISDAIGEAHSKLIEIASTAPGQVDSKSIESMTNFLDEVRSKPLKFISDFLVGFVAVGIVVIVLSIVMLIGSGVVAYSVAVGIMNRLMDCTSHSAVLDERPLVVFAAILLAFLVVIRTAFSASKEVLKLALAAWILRLSIRTFSVLSDAVLGTAFVIWGARNLITSLVVWGVRNLATVIIAGGVALVVTGMATLPLPVFLLPCWLVSFSLSPEQIRKPGIVIVISFYLLLQGFQSLGWGSLIVALVALSGYCRLIPDYLVLALLSRLVSLPLVSRLYPSPGQRLSILPPYTTELLWLPLPNHDRLLADAFRADTSAALATFQQMQASLLPGFKHTIKLALPQILADQYSTVTTIHELINTSKPEHPLLPLLSPFIRQVLVPFLPQEGDASDEPPTSVAVLPRREAEVFLIPSSLYEISEDVEAALAAGSAALRERSLERILDKLVMLQLQIPSFVPNAQAIKRWQPVMEHWQQVIQLELEEQQKQSQGEQLNPFQYGNPLRRERPYLFKGRQAFADNIVRLVLDRNRPTLVLHGPRRFGKSSFLLNLPRLLPGDMLPIYLDMQSAAVTTDEAAFCQGLVRAISKDSRSQGVELPAIPQRKEFLDTPYIALEDWLEQAVPKLGDRRLLLNLDEFEKIGSAINEGRMSLNLFNELRHLIQHYEQLGFLFSGVQTLDELGPNWSSYFISVVPIEMLYLEPHEAEDLLVNPDPEFTLRYDTGIVEEILTLTRCHPYLLQLIGWSLVNLANENHTQLVTSNLLQAAIPEAFTNGQPYFTNVWTEFTGTSPAEVKAGQELLLALAQGHQPTSVTGNETARAARQRLLRYHVIEHIDGSDHFEIPLIERWVRERAITN